MQTNYFNPFSRRRPQSGSMTPVSPGQVAADLRNGAPDLPGDAAPSPQRFAATGGYNTKSYERNRPTILAQNALKQRKAATFAANAPKLPSQYDQTTLNARAAFVGDKNDEADVLANAAGLGPNYFQQRGFATDANDQANARATAETKRYTDMTPLLSEQLKDKIAHDKNTSPITPGKARQGLDAATTMTPLLEDDLKARAAKATADAEARRSGATPPPNPAASKKTPATPAIPVSKGFVPRDGADLDATYEVIKRVQGESAAQGWLNRMVSPPQPGHADMIPTLPFDYDLAPALPSANQTPMVPYGYDPTTRARPTTTMLPYTPPAGGRSAGPSTTAMIPFDFDAPRRPQARPPVSQQLPTPPQPPTPQRPATTKLSPDQARELVREAGGDKSKAMTLAIERGLDPYRD